MNSAQSLESLVGEYLDTVQNSIEDFPGLEQHRVTVMNMSGQSPDHAFINLINGIAATEGITLDGIDSYENDDVHYSEKLAKRRTRGGIEGCRAAILKLIMLNRLETLRNEPALLINEVRTKIRYWSDPKNAPEELQWDDAPHMLHVRSVGSKSELILTVIKTGGTEQLICPVQASSDDVKRSWKGTWHTEGAPGILDDTSDFHELRSLEITGVDGAAIGHVNWKLKHIRLPTGKTYTKDKLYFESTGSVQSAFG